MKTLLFILLFFSFYSYVDRAGASPGYLNVHSKIVKPDGTPLEASSVHFRITFTDPVGTCVVFQEDFTNVNMANSKGLAAIQVGTGTQSFPVAPITLPALFTNFGSPVFNCQSGGTFTAANTDERKMILQFNDGTGWQTLPSMTVNSVPFALTSNIAHNLGAFPAADYVRTAQFTSCNSGEAVFFNGTSFTCVAIAAGVSNGGNTGATTIGTNDASNFTIETNNSPRLTVDSTGNIGIGTATPSATLDVKKSLTTAGTPITLNQSTLRREPGTPAETAPVTLLSVVMDNQASSDFSDNIVGGSFNLSTGSTMSNYTNITAVQSSVMKSGIGDITGESIGVHSAYFDNSIAGTAASVTGFKAEINKIANASTITNAFGVSSQITRAAGTITNGYGVHIGNIQATNKFSLFATDATAPSYFAGNVGIGTTTPSGKLDVQGGTAAASTNGSPIQIFSQGGGSGNTNGGHVEIRQGSESGSGAPGSIFLGSKTAYDGTGFGYAHVNIANPSASKVGLNIVSGGPYMSMFDYGGNVRGTIYNDGSMMFNKLSGTFSASGNLTLDSTTDATKGFVLINPSGGNVGIGTSSPNEMLSVAGNIELTNTVNRTIGVESTILGEGRALSIFSGSAAGGAPGNLNLRAGNQVNNLQPGGSVFIDPGAGSARGNILLGSSGGNVGIGTSAPSEKLHVVGNLRVQGSTDCTLGNGGGGTNCSSDIRLKNNVTEIENALGKILQIRGVDFDWNEKSRSPGAHAIGVIAQEVESVFPTAVMTDTVTGIKKVDYAVLVAPLIEAVKDLKKENDDLKQRLEKLESLLLKNISKK